MNDPKMLIQEQLVHNNWGVLGTQGYVLGVDLGGYGLRVALVDLHNHTYTSGSGDIDNLTPPDVIDTAIKLAQSLLTDAGVASDRLVRIGVGFGGPVDPFHGVIRLSTRVSGWENFPVKEHFENAFDTVTLVDNDANLIALGEATFGIGRGSKHLFYMHLSKGVGGGIVLDGQLYHGATATAGEVGQALVGHGWDGISQPATLEELICIDGLARRAHELGLQTDNLNDIFGDNPIGQQVVSETVSLLAVRLGQIVALLDPEIIVLGGIVVRIGGEPFVTAIEQQLQRFVPPKLARPVKVVASVLGQESIAIGALALALKSLQE